MNWCCIILSVLFSLFQLLSAAEYQVLQVIQWIFEFPVMLLLLFVSTSENVWLVSWFTLELQNLFSCVTSTFFRLSENSTLWQQEETEIVSFHIKVCLLFHHICFCVAAIEGQAELLFLLNSDDGDQSKHWGWWKKKQFFPPALWSGASFLHVYGTGRSLDAPSHSVCFCIFMTAISSHCDCAPCRMWVGCNISNVVDIQCDNNSKKV